MNEYLGVFAKNLGLFGALVSLSAIVLRVLGMHYIFRVEAITVMQGGMVLMLVSCVIHLNYLNKR